ncbi:sucrose-6-phosphate hydrolase [Mogibacterium diversum]|jgi:hypothetical protein|uniref:Sucrose-6-phosphate hydrolase n=1 Tax=Mogibacterium diversum TaxID=114527 RepID=A0A2S0L4C0_9FIRM|nr:sucrose-6-phosphate hydrolase [Mogibacterium diversum]AVM48111.1 sucrose-6-phosphate hydrolase [Mogibacterium diversum]
MKDEELIYLDTYVLQKDMRIRMPKSILENLNIEKGKSKFKVYYDQLNVQLILRVDEDENK